MARLPIEAARRGGDMKWIVRAVLGIGAILIVLWAWPGEVRAWTQYDSSEDVVLTTSEFVPRLKIEGMELKGLDLTGIELRLGTIRSSGLGGGLILGGYYQDWTSSGRKVDVVPLFANASIHLFPCSRLSPYLGVGAGGMVVHVSGLDPGADSFLDNLQWVWAGRGEAGLKFWLSRYLGLEFAAVYDRTTPYIVDGVDETLNGLSWRFGISLTPEEYNIAVASQEVLDRERGWIWSAHRVAALMEDVLGHGTAGDPHNTNLAGGGAGTPSAASASISALPITTSEAAPVTGAMVVNQEQQVLLWVPVASANVHVDPHDSYYCGLADENEVTIHVGPGVYRVRVGNDLQVGRLLLPSCAAPFEVDGEVMGPRGSGGGVMFVSTGNGYIKLTLKSLFAGGYHDGGEVVLERLDLGAWWTTMKGWEPPSFIEPAIWKALQ